MKYCQVSPSGQISGPQWLPASFANVSNFNCLSPSELATYGWYPLMKTAPPTINPATTRLDQKLQLVGPKVVESWQVVTLTPAEQMDYLRQQKSILKQLLDQHMDAQVAPRDFDGIQTAITWADSTNPTWAADGIAAKSFRQRCYEIAYKIESDVLAGLRAVPTPAQFSSEMPVLWAPPSNANGTS